LQACELALPCATGTQRDVAQADFEAALVEVRPSLVRGAEVDLPKGQGRAVLRTSQCSITSLPADK
jgi:hypothetical protein